MRRKNLDLIQEEWADEDGYWIALIDGYMNLYDPHCHQIHEDTKKEARDILADVVPCTCADCTKGTGV